MDIGCDWMKPEVLACGSELEAGMTHVKNLAGWNQSSVSFPTCSVLTAHIPLFKICLHKVDIFHLCCHADLGAQ